jgi:hypothetical protein
VSGCLHGIISASSKVVKYTKGSKWDLGHWHSRPGACFFTLGRLFLTSGAL